LGVPTDGLDTVSTRKISVPAEDLTPAV
jgi:hypothetical protein